MDKLLSSVEDIKEKLTDKEYKNLMDTMKEVKEENETKDKYVKVLEIKPKLVVYYSETEGGETDDEFNDYQRSGLGLTGNEFNHDSTKDDSGDYNPIEKLTCKSFFTVRQKVLKVEKSKATRLPYSNEYIEVDYLKTIKGERYLDKLSSDEHYITRLIYLCDM